jgi:hypothetical protein
LLCEAVGEHLSSRYVAQVNLSVSSHFCSEIVLGRNVCNCSSAVDSVIDGIDGMPSSFSRCEISVSLMQPIPQALL